jgi:2,3-dihydroxybenzoate decarboxylase
MTQAMVTRAADDYYRISTEETFGISEVYDATADLAEKNPSDEVGLGVPPKGSEIVKKLLDLGEGRIADMDAGRIDKQVLSLWSPGVQIFDPVQGTELAAWTNDILAAAVRSRTTA